MTTLTIYQKPTCSTCRNVMKLLSDAGIDYDSINYITDPPSLHKLKELIKKMGIDAREFIRKNEPEYKELKISKRNLSDSEVVDIFVKYPSLIQRPILEYGDAAVLGRPIENVERFLKEHKIK